MSHCHSRLHRNAQTKSTCSTVYLSANSRYLLPYRCNTSRETHSERRGSDRCLRHTNRPCSPPSLVALSKADSFVSAAFASVYDLALQDLRSNDSHPHLSIDYGSTALEELAPKLQNSSLGELAPKLQNLHRWGSSRTRRWRSLLGSSRLYIAGEALESASLGELARQLRADQNICSRQNAQADAVGEC